ncbi:hypothetical protein [Baaleninema simplex]|uniref:hypothetical protein n=1 Tax=Baaleninema simplex TaxID=2862350 RepID=UPI000347A317|nr:hypothetical protein [Baaleninema simplex]
MAFPHPPQRSRSRATRTVSVESASGRCHNIQGRDLQAIANGSQTMGVEYDWVVLGDSTAGMRAASGFQSICFRKPFRIAILALYSIDFCNY